MNIILTEQQFLIIESQYDSWGCNLFPEKSEKKEWCINAQNKIRKKQSIVQKQIDKIGENIREDSEVSYREKVLYYTEGDPFFNENVDNLNLAEKLILPTCEKAKKVFDEFKLTLAEKFLFVDKKNDEYVYNQLNKLNSNYSALAYLLTEYRDRKKLNGEPFEEIFKIYFEPPSADIIDTVKESPFYNLIIGYFSNREEAIKIMSGVFKTIKGTTDIGAKSEESAFKFLSDNFGEKNVKIFSGDFSWPDFLGVDMLVNEEELGWGWVPTQIKTDVSNCYPNRKFCKNICIGKNKLKNKRWEIKIYDGGKEIHPSEI